MITGIRNGKVVIAYINGKAYRREFDDKQEAVNAYAKLREVKNNPNKQNIASLEVLMSPSKLVEYNEYINFDTEKRKFYLADTEIEMPQEIVDLFDDYIESGEPINAILNFWKLLSKNPVERVRLDLFKFLMQYDFGITDKGYFIAYKAVRNLEEDVTLSTYGKVLQKLMYNRPVNRLTDVIAWRTEEGDIVIQDGNETTEINSASIERIGSIQEILNNPDNFSKDGVKSFTDKHSGTMNITLGVPVRQRREDCDIDPIISCGRGLHVGATSYVNNFAWGNDSILVTLVNPAKVLSIPHHDNSKLRCTEYFPVGVAKLDEDGKIVPLEERYFEEEYMDFETHIEKCIDEDELTELDMEVLKVHKSTIAEIEVS